MKYKDYQMMLDGLQAYRSELQDVTDSVFTDSDVEEALRKLAAQPENLTQALGMAAQLTVQATPVIVELLEAARIDPDLVRTMLDVLTNIGNAYYALASEAIKRRKDSESHE